MELKELLERANDIRKSINEASTPIRADKNDIDNNSIDYLQGELNELVLEYDETKDTMRKSELETRILDKADTITTIIETKKNRKEEATLYVDSKKSEIKQKIKELTEQNKKLYVEKSKPLQKRRDDINKRIEEIATDPKRVEELKGLIAERDQVLKENSEILREHFKRQNTIRNLRQELRRLEEIDLENEDDISKVLKEKAEEEEKNKSNIYNMENPEQDGGQPKEPKSGARKVKVRVAKKGKPVSGPKKFIIPEQVPEPLPQYPLGGGPVAEPATVVQEEPEVVQVTEPEPLPQYPLGGEPVVEPATVVQEEPEKQVTELESLPEYPLGGETVAEVARKNTRTEMPSRVPFDVVSIDETVNAINPRVDEINADKDDLADDFEDDVEVQQKETYGKNDSDSYIDMKNKLIALIDYVELDTLKFICDELKISDRLPSVEIAEKILELSEENIERYIKMLEENSRLKDFFEDNELPIAQEEKGIKAFGKRLLSFGKKALEFAKNVWTKVKGKIGNFIENIKGYFEGLEENEDLNNIPDGEFIDQEEENIFPEGTFRGRRERWIDDSINSQGTVSTPSFIGDRHGGNQTTSKSQKQDGQEQRR